MNHCEASFVLLRILKRAVLFLVLGLILFLLLGVLLSPASIVRDEPRNLPWTLPDYRGAQSHWEIGDDGRIHTWVEHFFLEDISPAMVSWFYRHLPISSVRYQGEILPLYHFFHPTEHGTLRLLLPASDGTQGMGIGAVIEREEWFGLFDSRGTARIAEFSDAGFLAIPEVVGFKIGEVRHQFTAVNGGTAYRVDTVLGSQLPVVGTLLNWYLRTQVFHPQMIRQWQRHQIEEVSSLQFFLPQIYVQKPSDELFNIQ